jgi:prevent-host-death family protein
MTGIQRNQPQRLNMMQKTQQFEPITTMQRNPNKVLAMLVNGPVIMASRSKPAAILVSVELWDRLVERLEDQEDIIDALEAKLAIATGQVEMMTQSEIQEWLSEDMRVSA